MPLRLIVVDDHTLVRSGVISLLKDAGLEVVGEASDGQGVLKLARATKPTMAVMDVSLPNLNGIEATRELRRELPQIRVLMLSMHADRQYVHAALEAGATGYVLKDAPSSVLIEGIQAVAVGRTFLCKTTESLVLDDYMRRAMGDNRKSTLEELSPRERHVLQQIAEGKSSREIAKNLHISVHTVESHRRNIMKKLDIHNIVELVRFALRSGVASLD